MRATRLGNLCLTAVCALAFGVGGCAEGVPDDGTTNPAAALAGVVRLGPPAPSVGIYGIAAPGNGKVYVSNLHVPFLTVADAETGAWIDAIDLRDGCTEQAFFSKLLVTGDTLWVTLENEGRLCRWDLASEGWLDPVDVGMFGGVAADGDDLWVAVDGAVRRYQGATLVETLRVDGFASALDLEGDAIALLFGPDHRLAVIGRDGAPRWEAAGPQAGLNDIALLGGRAFVTGRSAGHLFAFEAGEELARVPMGSDTFAVDRLGDMVMVTSRQGAALPASGAYEGAPAVVTAVDAELVERWSVELDKTIHFLAYDGALVWAANEDALRLSAIDPVAGVEVFRGEPLGLTIDHLALSGDEVVFGSHLTDELWAVDLAGAARSVDTCGWPFVAVPMPEGLVVPCQEDGRVMTVDPDTFEVLADEQVADTFFPACPAGLCTGHDTLLAAAADGDRVVWSDAYTGALRWNDGAEVDLGDFPDAGGLRHFDVAAFGEGVFAFEPRTETLYRVEAGAVVGTRVYTDETAPFAFVADEDRMWVGGVAIDAALADVATLPGGAVAQTAGEGWIVATVDEELVVYDRGTLAERGRLALPDLRVPPWRGLDDTLNPLRFRVRDGELLVANTMRGTIERRALPGLGPCGDDTPVALGRWAEWEGLR